MDIGIAKRIADCDPGVILNENLGGGNQEKCKRKV